MTLLASYALTAAAAFVGVSPYAVAWAILRRRDTRPRPMSIALPQQPARFS